MSNINVRKITFAGIVAALYAAMTLLLSFSAYTPIQFRVAEVLCILPFFFPHSVWGLFIGCIIANIFSPYQLDVFVGPIASLLAALCTMWIGKSGGSRRVSVKALACLPPVLINAVLIGAMIAYIMVSEGEADSFLVAFAINGLEVGIGQTIVLYAIGFPLMIYLPKSRFFTKMLEYYK